MSFEMLFSAKIGCVMIQLNKWLQRIFHNIITPFRTGKASSNGGVFLVCGKEVTMAEREEKTIYCPKCNRKAFSIYADSEMVMKSKCSKCRKMVVYNPRYGVQLKPLSQLRTSSAVRF